MKRYAVDVEARQFPKHGEDICGDSYKVFRTSDSTVIALSDGLGSGVKANVLSTLTVEIVGGLVTGELSAREVVETLVATLPVCKWRGVAYSTFSILRIFDNGLATLIEYDCPSSLLVRRDEKVIPIAGNNLNIMSKEIRESHFRLKPGDMCLQMSDGIVHAGIGATLNLGWQEEGIKSYLAKTLDQTRGEPKLIADKVINQANDLWLYEPGDDGTAITTRYRRARNKVVITGPAEDRNDTPKMIEEFLAFSGDKIVCGGTTSHLVADRIQKEMQVDHKYMESGLPPTAKLSGMELVTEGMLTLNRAVDYIKNGVPDKEENAATELLDRLSEADGIRFMVGSARNAAHQNARFPTQMLLRRSVVETLAEELRKTGKTVEVLHY